MTRGSRPFARLSLNGNAAYTAGSPLILPFTSGISGTLISASFGQMVSVPGFNGGVPIFCCQPGIYLVQLQLQLNTSPTTTTVVLTSTSGSASDSGVTRGGPGLTDLTCTMNANRLATETPFPNAPTNLPNLIYCTLLASGGGNGAVQSAGTHLFIEQLTANVP